MAKTLTGIVVSDKPDKSIVVAVQSSKTHPLYRKKYTSTKRYMAHDEKNEAVAGDKVSIVESRPMSATKRFKLAKVIERPLIRQHQTVEAITAEPALEKPEEKTKNTKDKK